MCVDVNAHTHAHTHLYIEWITTTYELNYQQYHDFARSSFPFDTTRQLESLRLSNDVRLICTRFEMLRRRRFDTVV